MEGPYKKHDIEPEELIKALNDEDHANSLMAERGWSKQDLIKRAQRLTKELEASIAHVNVV